MTIFNLLYAAALAVFVLNEHRYMPEELVNKSYLVCAITIGAFLANVIHVLV